MADRPLIGITGPDRVLRWGWWAARRAVSRAGGRPLRLTPRSTDRPPRIAGLIIGGGSDVDPALYDADAPVAVDPARDAFEIRMIEWALGRGLPVLGICRGAQLINVVHGGNLHQDVRPLRRLTSNRATLLPRKGVRVESESRLHAIVGTSSLVVNSLHWQAINRLGHQLRVVARDRDHIVQAVERRDDVWCMGVQWHPEYIHCLGPQHSIFEAVIAAARRR